MASTELFRLTPHIAALDAAVAGSGGMLAYERASQMLTVTGKLEDALYRTLLTCYGNHPDRAVVQVVLRDLRLGGHRKTGHMWSLQNRP